MDPWGLLKELREGWPDVRAAKWAVFVALATGAVTGFAVATLWWTGTVSTLRERLLFSQDRLQIALSSPNNPAALLTKEPGRHLTEQDRKCIVQNFKEENKNFRAIYITAFSDDESLKYAGEFLNLFLRMGYRSGVAQGGSTNYDDVGVMIGFKDVDNPSDEAKRFAELFGKCKLGTHKAIRFSPPPNLLPDISNLDFDLYIGPKE